jgi:hypothetical protein
VGTHGRITFTIPVHSRYRAREEARELGEWLNSSLEGILVEEGLWETGTGPPAPDIPKIIEVLDGPWEESPALGDGDTVIRTSTIAEFLSAHFQAKWTVEAGGRSLPSPCIHPPRDLVKERKGNWEGAGAPDEETTLIERRKDELCVATIESVENGWSLLRGLGSPEEIPLAGPNPIPADFDLEDFLTRTQGLSFATRGNVVQKGYEVTSCRRVTRWLTNSWLIISVKSSNLNRSLLQTWMVGIFHNEAFHSCSSPLFSPDKILRITALGYVRGRG